MPATAFLSSAWPSGTERYTASSLRMPEALLEAGDQRRVFDLQRQLDAAAPAAAFVGGEDQFRSPERLAAAEFRLLACLQALQQVEHRQDRHLLFTGASSGPPPASLPPRRPY